MMSETNCSMRVIHVIHVYSKKGILHVFYEFTIISSVLSMIQQRDFNRMNGALLQLTFNMTEFVSGVVGSKMR